MKKMWLVILLIVFPFNQTLAQGPLNNSVNQEQLSQLYQELQKQIAYVQPSEEYFNWVCQDAFLRFSTIESASQFILPQYFIYVDRNPDRQLIFIGFYDPGQKVIYQIGWDKVSTGKPQRKGHFLTPTGVFANSTINVGYRAEGTKNSRGWRGLGRKGSRVWDFGWQWTDHTYKGQPDSREIRLLLHATDPDFGEPRLGKPDSKGCVRISNKLNWFLDLYGILDANYEAKSQEFSWLLNPKRQVVDRPGQYLIVGDSTNQNFGQLVAQLTP